MTTVFEITERMLHDGGPPLTHDIALRVFSSYKESVEYLYKTVQEDMNEHASNLYYYTSDDDNDDNDDNNDNVEKCSSTISDNIKSFFETYNTVEKFKELNVFNFGYQCYVDGGDAPSNHTTKWLYIFKENDKLEFNFPRPVSREEEFYFDSNFKQIKSLPNINEFICNTMNKLKHE